MIYLFSILIWLPLIHGAVLWIALRFKDKKWRWYWFSGVLLVGWGAIWIDALYVKFVIIEGYCKQEAKLGYFEYQSADADAKDVIWLDTPEAKNKTPHAIEEFPWLSNPEILYCINEKNGKKEFCKIPGFRTEHAIQKRHFNSWMAIDRLWKNEQLLREHVMFRWNEWWVLQVVGFPEGNSFCSGPDRGIFIHKRKYYPSLFLTISVN
ncbi:MAG: hypothetical protein Q7U62_03845 [Burkholderiaceae bacterium]|nr:hypothetical protein [Burkholderiaceae bacterium]